MSEIVELLQAGRKLAWLGLVPAFDHAILLAQEAGLLQGLLHE